MRQRSFRTKIFDPLIGAAALAVAWFVSTLNTAFLAGRSPALMTAPSSHRRHVDVGRSSRIKRDSVVGFGRNSVNYGASHGSGIITRHSFGGFMEMNSNNGIGLQSRRRGSSPLLAGVGTKVMSFGRAAAGIDTGSPAFAAAA